MAKKEPLPPRHTPGPWHFGPWKEQMAEGGAARFRDSKKGFYVGPVNGVDVAQLECTSSRTRKEQMANAALIAAAPDLLEVCKRFLETRPRDRHNIDLELYIEFAVKKAESPD